MKRLLDWIKESNRWKHALGGAAIGLIANTPYCAVLAGTGVASALELKDKMWGGKWDWVDWALTVSGVATGYTIRVMII